MLALLLGATAFGYGQTKPLRRELDTTALEKLTPAQREAYEKAVAARKQRYNDDMARLEAMRNIVAAERLRNINPYLVDDPSELEKITVNDLASYDINDHRLAVAYSYGIISNPERIDGPQPWLDAIKNDIRRRGNAATPLLLRLFNEYPDASFKQEMLRKIEYYPMIDMAPYLQAARDWWQKEGERMDSRSYYSIAVLLSNYGDKEDLAILKEMPKVRPMDITSATSYIRRMEKRLSGALKPNEWHYPMGLPPPGYDWGPRPKASIKPVVNQPVFTMKAESDESWSLLFGCVLLAILSGLVACFFYLKKLAVER